MNAKLNLPLTETWLADSWRYFTATVMYYELYTIIITIYEYTSTAYIEHAVVDDEIVWNEKFNLYNVIIKTSSNKCLSPVTVIELRFYYGLAAEKFRWYERRDTILRDSEYDGDIDTSRANYNCTYFVPLYTHTFIGTHNEKYCKLSSRSAVHVITSYIARGYRSVTNMGNTLINYTGCLKKYERNILKIIYFCLIKIRNPDTSHLIQLYRRTFGYTQNALCAKTPSQVITVGAVCLVQLV